MPPRKRRLCRAFRGKAVRVSWSKLEPVQVRIRFQPGIGTYTVGVVSTVLLAMPLASLMTPSPC